MRTKEQNQRGYKVVGLDCPFTKPKGYKRINWKKKYTPSWALHIPITGIIYE